MKKQIITATALLLGVITGPALAVEVTGNAGFVTEYLFRGLPQTDGKAAAQGGIDAAWESGFYLGTWGSSVRSGDSFGGGELISGESGVEVDLYGGFSGESGDFNYGAGFTFYTYSDDFDEDYLELNLSGGWQWLTLDIAIGEYDTDPEEDYNFYSLTGEWGHFYTTYGNFSDDFDGSYIEFGYTNTLTVAETDLFDYSISFVHSDEDLFVDDDSENTLIFGVTKSFDISSN